MTMILITNLEADPSVVTAVRALIAAAQRVLIITHLSPDGDAVGSTLGLGWALRALGKDVVFACVDPIPEALHFLPGASEFTAHPEGAFDLIAVVDVSEAPRMGALNERLPSIPQLVFDHHITNPGFGEYNFIDATKASTTELIALWLEPLGLSLDRVVAECLLTGLVTDTLGFRTPNTTAGTFAVAQRLIEVGVDLARVYDLGFYKRSFDSIRFWARGLHQVKLDNGLIWTSLTLAARKAVGIGGNGDADLINVLASVREARVAVIFVERPENKVKVSWRSDGTINVAAVAQQFGGGGHYAAAGAEITGGLAETEARVIAATKSALAQTPS
jgi:phosphoesterase RecJ-like protein